MANSSTANAHLKLIGRLLANLPAGYTAGTLTSNVKLPNRPFDTPVASKWMRPTVIVTDVNNTQASGDWKQYDGLFVIDIFYPKGNDTIAILTEAETIAALFENQAFDSVNCQASTITTTEEDTWYICQIETTFYFEGL